MAEAEDGEPKPTLLFYRGIGPPEPEDGITGSYYIEIGRVRVWGPKHLLEWPMAPLQASDPVAQVGLSLCPWSH